MNFGRSALSICPPRRSSHGLQFQVVKLFSEALRFHLALLLVAFVAIAAGDGGLAQELRSTGKSSFSNFEERSRETDYWEQVHKRENEDQLQEKELQKQKRAEARSRVVDLVQAGQTVQLELAGAPVEADPPPPPSIFEGKEDHIRLGLMVVLLAFLFKFMRARHQREAEISKLCGGYLSDGREVASMLMPEWFALAPVAEVASAATPDEADTVSAADLVRAQMAEFFELAPQRLAAIQSALSAFKELESSGPTEARQQALSKVHGLVSEVRDQATCWDLRPAWQISSALELLLKRVLDKPKDFTPSIVRTVAAAVDVLREVCVPGIRTNLLMDPPPRILAVDDDALCRRALQFAFEKANLMPDLAESGERAVALATANTYDVVFMDIQMPGIGGLVACNHVHGTNKNADVPVIFVTSQSDFNTRAESRLMGGVDLMAKPFLIFELTVRAVTFAARNRLQAAKPGVVERPALTPAAVLPQPVPVQAAPSVLVETTAPVWPAETISPVAPAGPRPRKVAELDGDDCSTTPDHHAETRRIFEDLHATTDPAGMMELTGLLYLRIHAVATQAAQAKRPVAAHVSSTLEALLKRLYRNPQIINPSTLNTVGHALKLLEHLSTSRLEAKLAHYPSMHFLVVDDEPLARRAVVGALQLAFEQPESAQDGAEAAALAAKKMYDVIFTDVQMPVMDGFELCAAIRRSALNARTPVIFITSQSDDETLALAAASGGNDFIGKPFLPIEITVKALTFAWEARLQEVLAASVSVPVPEDGFNSPVEQEQIESLVSA